MSRDTPIANFAATTAAGRFNLKNAGLADSMSVAVWCCRCGLEEISRRQRDAFSRGAGARHRLLFARHAGPAEARQDSPVRVICDHCAEVAAD